MDKLNKLGEGNSPPLSKFTKPVLAGDVNKVIDKLNEVFALTYYSNPISHIDILGLGNTPQLSNLTKPVLISEVNEIIDVINEAIDIINTEEWDLSSLNNRLYRYGISNVPPLSKNTKPVLTGEFNLIINKINELITHQATLVNQVPDGAILTEDGLNYLITEDGLFAIAYEPYPASILTEDETAFLITEDELNYLQQT